MTDVTDAMVEQALYGRVPGGSPVWVWIAQDDAFKPSQTARDVVRAALEAATLAPSEAIELLTAVTQSDGKVSDLLWNQIQAALKKWGDA